MLDELQLSFVRSHLDFYAKLTTSEKEELERAIYVTRFTKGVALKSKDDECLGLLLVHIGELRTYIQSEDGREVALYRIGPGELCILSASCILNNITFDVSIDAKEDTEVFKINMTVFDRIMKQNVWVENFAYKNAMERFSDVMWAIEQIIFMRFDKRLAIYLLDESAKASAVEIKVTHEEIAKNIGSAREVVSRMLKSFESEGFVEIGRGSVRILRREGLKGYLSSPQ